MSKRDLKQRLDELFTSPDEPAPSPDEGWPRAAQAEPEAPLLDAGERAHGNAALLAEIAELKQIQAERERLLSDIRQSEQLLRSVIDATPDWVFIKDQAHRYRLVNQSYAHALHFSSQDFIGKNDLELGFPEELVKGNPEKGIRGFWADDRLAMDSGETQVYADDPATIDGVVHTFHTIKTPLRDADGKVWGVLAFARDITERKQAEDELRRFHLGIERSTEAVFITDIQGMIVYANPAFETVYGYRVEEVLGKTPRILKSGLIPPEGYTAFWATLLNKQAVVGEIVNKTRDGRLIPIEGSNTPILDDAGNILGFLAVHRDITERKQAEEALSRRALQLQTAADVSRAASSILNGDELLASTVDLIRERFSLYYVGLFLVDEARQYAVLRAGTGEAGRTMIERGHRLAVGDASMIGWCVANRHARIALDVGQDATRFDNPLLPETRSELALPLIARGEVLGAMTVQSTQAEAFSEIDIAVLRTMTDQVANAIANARLFEQARQQLAELSAVSAISRVLASRLGLDSLIELSVDTIRETFGVNNAYIAVYDSRTHTVRIPCMVEDDQKLSIEPFPLGQGLTSAIIQSRQPLLIDQDVERRLAELGARQAGAPAKSFLGVPMIVGDEVIGTICIQDTRRPDLFGEDELRLLTTIAPGVGIAIQNARLFEQTQAALAESRRLARRAELVNRISGKIRAAVSVDDVLHIAVDELRQATRSTHALARLDAPGRTNGNGQHDSGPQGVAHE